MPSRRLPFVLCLFAFALAAAAQDVHFKKEVSVGGNVVSSSDVSIKGARERTVSTTATGKNITVRQCDLKRTVTLNEQTQAYLVTEDPKDEAALRAAALLNGEQPPAAGPAIIQTTTLTDTGERKPMMGFTARHLKTTVDVESAQGTCSQVSQKYEIDGWYADLNKEEATCSQSLPPVRETGGCHDPVIQRHSGNGKPGYPLTETIVMHNADSSTMEVNVSISGISKQPQDAKLFDVPASYRQVNSVAELNTAAPQPSTTASNFTAPTQFSGANSGATQQNPMQQTQPMQQQFGNAGTNNMSQFTNGMNGANGSGGMQGSNVPIPSAVGPKAPGMIRIGVAPAQAQLGQGNNAGADYGTPIRNSIILLMNGPAVEITALDSRIPVQVQAEAQQKQCDYILMSSVAVKHGGGAFGSFMKAAGPMSNMVPMIGMTKTVGGMIASQAASSAMQTAAQVAQQQAMNQLAGFNGQIKQKDDVTVQYELYPTGQTQAKLANTLKGKAKTDGEDVLTPLIQQAATTVLTEVTKK